MTKIKKVLIVGGGIGGLSTAIALRKVGVEVEIAEIHQEFNVYGVGIILPPNSIRALNQLGVAVEILKNGAVWDRWRLYDGEGNFLVEPETFKADEIDYYGGLSRRHLHTVLYETALKHGTKMRMGTSVETIENKQNGAWVTLTDGTSGEYDLIIGADGAYSKVRKMLFPDQMAEFAGEAVWRYPFKGQLEHGVMYLGKNAKAGLVPMTKDTFYLFLVTVEPGNPWKEPNQLASLLRESLQEFGGKIGELRERITDPKLVIYRPIETVLVEPTWYKGRTLLIGDAAHATAPHLAQGAGISIEDGLVLAELIKEERDPLELLEQFMEWRYERCKLVVDGSNLLVNWEIMLKNGEALPQGASVPEKMDEITLQLTDSIYRSSKHMHPSGGLARKEN